MTRPTEPLVVTAAEVRVSQRIAVELKHPGEIVVEPGRALHLNLLYFYEESDQGRESTHLRLHSAIGAQRPEPVEVRYGDTPFVKDARQGFIGHRYLFPSAGTHDGEFRVAVEHSSRPWSGGGAEQVERAERTASLRVVVR